MPGIEEFYMDRLRAARAYGPRSADGIMEVVIRCAEYDRKQQMLTHQQYQSIMKAADDLFYEILTGGLNDGN